MLYEHAAGYALFRVSEFEEIGALLPQVEAAVIDYGKFSSIVKPVSFKPFKSAIAALENVNAISEGKFTKLSPLYLFFFVMKNNI